MKRYNKVNYFKIRTTMKKLYIAPSFFTVNILEEDIIAASNPARMDGNTGINMNNISADGGDAWNDACVKSHSVWDDEW